MCFAKLLITYIVVYHFLIDFILMFLMIFRLHLAYESEILGYILVVFMADSNSYIYFILKT